MQPRSPAPPRCRAKVGLGGVQACAKVVNVEERETAHGRALCRSRHLHQAIRQTGLCGQWGLLGRQGRIVYTNCGA